MSDTNQTPAVQGSSLRKQIFLLIFLAAIVLGAVFCGWWWLYSRQYETTDNAYVRGDVVLISSQVEGTATSVTRQNTDTVAEGDTLVEIDPADAQLKLGAAVNQLAITVRDVSSLFAEEDNLAAQVALRQTLANKADLDAQRRRAVFGQGGVSGEDLHHAEEAAKVSKSELRVAQAQLIALNARIKGTTLDSHPQVAAAKQRVREAYLALARTKVPAPLSGIVTKRVVQVGQHLAPGTLLMALVPLEHVWVEANFKESQLAHIKVGQAVELTADIYGDSVVYHGHVQGMEAGSGAAFAAIPAQNATGNWIKVVQRVPVRIALDPQEVQQHPLRIGLSMTATVDLTAPGVQPPPRIVDATSVYKALGDGSDALISQTIADNTQASDLKVSGTDR